VLIDQVDRVGQRLEAVRAPRREIATGGFVDLDRRPLEEGCGPAPEVDDDVERAADRTAHQLGLGVRRALEMQAADRPPAEGHRVVDLDPVRVQPGSREFALAILALEAAARVGADVVADGERSGDAGRRELHDQPEAAS